MSEQRVKRTTLATDHSRGSRVSTPLYFHPYKEPDEKRRRSCKSNRPSKLRYTNSSNGTKYRALQGELDGLELEIEFEPRQAAESLRAHIKIASALKRLKGLLRGLWQKEEDWTSIDVFVPIYELVLSSDDRLQAMSLISRYRIHQGQSQRPPLKGDCRPSQPLASFRPVSRGPLLR
jgi:hypothetical protein